VGQERAPHLDQRIGLCQRAHITAATGADQGRTRPLKGQGQGKTEEGEQPQRVGSCTLATPAKSSWVGTEVKSTPNAPLI
jgi:hypothetical protein